MTLKDRAGQVSLTLGTVSRATAVPGQCWLMLNQLGLQSCGGMAVEGWQWSPDLRARDMLAPTRQTHCPAVRQLRRLGTFFGRLSEANPSAWLQFGLPSPGAEDLRSALQGSKGARVALGICTSAHHRSPSIPLRWAQAHGRYPLGFPAENTNMSIWYFPKFRYSCFLIHSGRREIPCK